MSPIIYTVAAIVFGFFALNVAIDALRHYSQKRPAPSPFRLNKWEDELLGELLLSDFDCFKMYCYMPFLMGWEKDLDNAKLRQVFSELTEDAHQCPSTLKKMVTPRAFEMLQKEAKRVHRLTLKVA
jgi:hypothetical protein